MLTKRVALAVAFFACSAAAADERQDLLKTLHDAELRLEESKRRVPQSFDLAEAQRFFRADVTPVTGAEQVGGIELHRVDVAGGAEQLRELLRAVATRDFRAGELESLRADQDHFTARFVLPVFKGYALSNDLRERLETVRVTQSAIDRMNWNRLRDVIALLDAPGESPAVRVEGVHVDGEMTLTGALVGVPARKALVANIEQAGFTIARLRLSPSGACRAFALTARRGEAETQTLFDLAPSALCRADAEPFLGRVAVKGTGGVTMRFRAIDLSDFFFVLHDLTDANFVVDGDVRGSVDVEVEQASLDAILAAIPGVHVSAGPLHHVSRTKLELQDKKYIGDPVSFVLTDARLADVLCLYESLQPQKFVVPAPFPDRVSVFVKERPWDEVLDAILPKHAEKASFAVCEIAANAPPQFSDFPPKLNELAAADLTLAGVAQTKAYAYGPWRRLLVLEKDARVFDGVVQSIAANRVRFAMDGKLVFDLTFPR